MACSLGYEGTSTDSTYNRDTEGWLSVITSEWIYTGNGNVESVAARVVEGVKEEEKKFGWYRQFDKNPLKGRPR